MFIPRPQLFDTDQKQTIFFKYTTKTTTKHVQSVAPLLLAYNKYKYSKI
jgi:hypothetical protein